MTPQSNTAEPRGCLPKFLRFLASSAEEKIPPEYPYEKKPYLMSKGERAFYGVLLECVSEDHQIFSKVRLADLIEVQKGTEKRQSYLNKITPRHIDFVICDRNHIRPLLAIELDDKSHQRADRVKRDVFVDGALESAGLPLLRIRAARSYEARSLAESIRKKIGDS